MYDVQEAMLECIRSYLHRRSFRASVASKLPKEFTATLGVPQGSVLGPLLFILFVRNKMKSVLSQDLEFDEDSKIYSKVDNCGSIMLLKDDISSVHEWSIRNRLSLNLAKPP
ncbi:uncharacterized protein LOC142332754 [Lycorma delicatula]|uniref:uncharacterized protein LOC142332754 n=1 Tax=Lycorma delicatula TaxID=130591 RepID=UPI003F516F7E